jgi:hypothetical protein
MVSLPRCGKSVPSPPFKNNDFIDKPNQNGWQLNVVKIKTDD